MHRLMNNEYHTQCFSLSHGVHACIALFPGSHTSSFQVMVYESKVLLYILLLPSEHWSMPMILKGKHKLLLWIIFSCIFLAVHLSDTSESSSNLITHVYIMLSLEHQ